MTNGWKFQHGERVAKEKGRSGHRPERPERQPETVIKPPAELVESLSAAAVPKKKTTKKKKSKSKQSKKKKAR